MLEIERRFLCRIHDRRVLDSAPAWPIRQGYIRNGEGPAIRVRRRGADFILTIKSGAGLVREEVEHPLPPKIGAELLESAGERIVEKTRHQIGRWEIDVFHGKLDGLLIAEVELSAEDEETPELPPGIELLREITFDRSLSNHSLAYLTPDEARRLVDRLMNG